MQAVQIDVDPAAVAVNEFVAAVSSQFPWRGRLLRRMVRSPFGLRCLLKAVSRA